MKYIRFFAMVILAGMLILSACRDKNIPVVIDDDALSVTPLPTDAVVESMGDIDEENIIEVMDDEELMESSIKLAEQMAKGRFSDTAEQFSETLKTQLDEESLKTVWESTVLLIGKYKGIEKELSLLETSGDYKICFVVLGYEDNGLSLSLTYNKDFEIDGLYINYYQLEPLEEMVQDDFDIRETAVKIGSGEYQLDGLLTLPEGVDNPPVIILIQGSGQSDKDETIGISRNKPFRDIARGLADRGIASLRYDKRFYTYPSLADITSDIYDEVLDDAYDAVRLVLSDERFDFEGIYILGHSLGGMLAPKIALMNEEVKGIISLAGSPRKLEDIMFDQNKEMLMQLEVYTEDEINALLDEVAVMTDKIKNLSDDNLEEPILGATGYYWKSLGDIDTALIAAELDIPMLILQGTEDFQVYPDVDYALWQELMEGRENVRFRLYEGLNHLFMPSSGIRGAKDYDEEAYVAEDVIDDIASWILTGELIGY